MLLIWSFTLQYGLSPALYLKGPTLFYVFILIALRALRFEPMLVLLTGGLAAAGWLILALLAARTAPATDDYPTYMTSLSILWGAEAEKLAAILAVTGVLALAVSRARTLLVRTEIERTAADDLSRFLDPGAARRVRAAEAALKPGDGELRPAAIMFVDLRGFSAAAAALPAREAIAILQEYQACFVPVLEAAGGSVDKYLGDGILVSFGAAEPTGREAAQAFEAIPALLAASERWIAERRARGVTPLQTAIAIATGDVIHGVIGHDDRLEFTVIGDAVNTAAKLEKHAKLERARVIVTQAALARASAQGAITGPFREIVDARVDGIADPIGLAVIE
jgi:adenylate cyclase